MQYNQAVKNNHGNKGKILSSDHKLKIGEANKGRPPSNKGKPMSDEQKEKIRKTLTGKKHTEERRKKNSEANKGKHHSPATQFKRGKNAGENHPNWKGGISTEHEKIRGQVEFRLWREAIFARDNWTCQRCKIKGGTLHAHHIQNFAQFPELRTAIDNGVTLCTECHKEFHRKYGRSNNTLEQLNAWWE